MMLAAVPAPCYRSHRADTRELVREILPDERLVTRRSINSRWDAEQSAEGIHMKVLRYGLFAMVVAVSGFTPAKSANK